MTYRFLLTLLLFAVTMSVCAQRIDRRQADSLTGSLRKGGKSIEDLYAMLQLADFNIQKQGEEKYDLDSAAGFIERAKLLNGSLRSSVGRGYIFLMESILDRERRLRAEGKGAAETAVSLLRNENDPALLGKAYFEMSEYYDYQSSAEKGTKIDYVEKALRAYEK